jgi:hypothetical protein
VKEINNTARITSLLKAKSLETQITGIPTLQLSELEISKLPEIHLPENRRLGHLAEHIVSELIKASENYRMLYENLQIIQDKQTIGELDFIIQHTSTQKIIHVELAYKFYLYDPTLATESIKNWIGPNRKDALHEKIEKLQQKQFPLLYHEATQAKLPEIDLKNISQQLCLIAYLFLPYHHQIPLESDFQEAVQGYYMNFETFATLHQAEKTYYIPPKKAWGIDPATHTTWSTFETIKEEITQKLAQKHAPMCWVKHHNTFEIIFIVWW